MKSRWETLSAEQQTGLVEAAQPLWEALGKLGWVDGWGGAEFRRVVPAALDFVHQEANRAPWQDKNPAFSRLAAVEEGEPSPQSPAQGRNADERT